MLLTFLKVLDRLLNDCYSLVRIKKSLLSTLDRQARQAARKADGYKKLGIELEGVFYEIEATNLLGVSATIGSYSIDHFFMITKVRRPGRRKLRMSLNTTAMRYTECRRLSHHIA